MRIMYTLPSYSTQLHFLKAYCSNILRLPSNTPWLHLQLSINFFQTSICFLQKVFLEMILEILLCLLIDVLYKIQLLEPLEVLLGVLKCCSIWFFKITLKCSFNCSYSASWSAFWSIPTSRDIKLIIIGTSMMHSSQSVFGGQLTMTLVATKNDILFSFFSLSSTFLIKWASDQTTYIAKLDWSAQKPKGRHHSRPHRSFWGPLAATLDFAGSAALQAVSECPLHR